MKYSSNKIDSVVGMNISKEKENIPLMIYPFGPAILKTQMPSIMVKHLNKAIDAVAQDEEASKMLDWSEHLVGKVEQEIIIPKHAFHPHLNWLKNQIQIYVSSSYERMGKPETNELDIRFISWWAVRSLAGDFNPVHFHTDCDLSLVGYLATPDWEEELKEDETDHYPCKGRIEFLDGRPQMFSNHRIQFRPEVGDVYIFPSWMQHTVYPFRKSKGERRSFSANIQVSIHNASM